MAGPLFVGAEGVILRPDVEHYGSSRPILEGIQLVDGLRRFPTSRVCIYCHTADEIAADFFCKVNGLSEVQIIVPPAVDLKEDAGLAQWHAFQRQRAMGPINLVLTAANGVYSMCMRSHQPVLLYGRRGAVGSPENTAHWGQMQEAIRRRREAEVERSNSPPPD